ncbi:hypothetical protein VKT23_020640 [Stygiomarasmius scandens]|uniref:Ubiquitin-like protease family profile domain-containing protein n=1 Tax=Marasmiellus scandens TaxID=2682957 RepID=A0ABR1IL21_9AGAR
MSVSSSDESIDPTLLKAVMQGTGFSQSIDLSDDSHSDENVDPELCSKILRKLQLSNDDVSEDSSPDEIVSPRLCSQILKEAHDTSLKSPVLRMESKPTQLQAISRGSANEADEYQPPNDNYVPQPDETINIINQVWPLINQQFFHPNAMTIVLSQLKTLQFRRWIDYSCIETYLILERLAKAPQDLMCNFVPQSFHTEYRVAPDMDIQELRNRYQRVFSGMTSQTITLASTLINPASIHWFGMVVNGQTQTAYILGKELEEGLDLHAADKWHEYQGLEIYQCLCELHGWSSDPPRKVFGVNWRQVGGTECGAYVGDVLVAIQNSGLATAAYGTPILQPLHCTHQFRVQALTTLHTFALLQISKYVTFFYNYPDLAISVDHHADKVVDSMEVTYLNSGGPQDHAQALLQEPLDNLKRAIDACERCHQEANHHQRQILQPISRSTASPPTLASLVDAYPLLKGARTFSIRVEHNSSGGMEINPPDVDSDPEDGGNSHSEHKDLQPKSSSLRSGQALPNLNQDAGVGRRFPRQIPSVPLLTVPLKGLFHSFQDGYDQYTGGPTLEALARLPEELGLFAHPTLYYYANQAAIINPLSSIDEWADRGWRLLPSSFQSFHLMKPHQLANHLLPEISDSPSSFMPDNNSDHDFDDAHTITLQDFLKLIKTDPMVALTGKMPPHPVLSDSYIQIDLQQDSQSPSILHKVVDIDSFIFLSRKPKFLASISFYSTPLHRNRAPLYRHNHVYLDLLSPPSPMDQARADPTQPTPPRSEWYTKTFKLSQIPHLSLARLSRGADLLIFFPRMTHKSMYSVYWATNIDYYMKSMFYDEILEPALRACKPGWDHQYAVHSQAEWSQKQGKSKTPISLEIQPNEWDTLLAEMSSKITSPFNAGRYDCFGSFFFCLTIKGCKDFTKTAVSDHETPDEALKRSLRKLQTEMYYFDFNSTDRDSGNETFVDIGFTVTPPNDPALVGLWKLDKLEESFGAGGYLSGQLHRLNTIDGVGGLMAEMKHGHMQQSHVLFSTAYNVIYEAFRRHDNEVQSFNIEDIAKNTLGFKDDYNHLISTLARISTDPISYGVRREFRVGFETLGSLASGAPEEPDAILKLENVKDSMLWIPKTLWCQFLIARAKALKTLHSTVYIRHPRPDNYLVLCGLISYLMQAIISTPVLVPTFVREALRNLYFGAVMARCGMFFLHDLDLAKANLIPSIRQKDDYLIWKEANININLPKAMDTYTESAKKDPHIGQKIAKSMLSQTLKNRPWAVVQDWAYPQSDLLDFHSALDSSPKATAAGLFMKFTVAVWQLLDDGKKRDSGPAQVASLKQALEFWTVRSRADALVGFHFRSIRGDTATAFAKRRSMWFPSCDVVLTGKWKLLQGAYINEYRKEISGTGPEQQIELDEALAHILTHCQCLPDSTDREPWHTDANRQVILVVNPGAIDSQKVKNNSKGFSKHKRSIMKTGKEFVEQMINLFQPGLPEKARKGAVRQFQNAMKQLKAKEKNRNWGKATENIRDSDSHMQTESWENIKYSRDRERERERERERKNTG